MAESWGPNIGATQQHELVEAAQTPVRVLLESLSIYNGREETR
jgi:hypothetical protein